MLTYLLGPFLAIFPKRWRESLPFSGYIRWARATAISGIAEFAAGLTALSYWYTRAMTAWVGHGVGVILNDALSAKTGPEVRPQDVGGVALIVWASHPLTLLFGYVCLEGTLRVGAAFTENGLGTLPFFLIDKGFSLIFGGRRPKHMSEGGNSGNGPVSMGGAIRERMAVAGLPLVPDELCVKKKGAEEILEICASRKKEGWDPPRIIRYLDVYYRLEAVFMGSRPRPFQYILRRLPAGVPGRTVLLYTPSEAVVRQER